MAKFKKWYKEDIGGGATVKVREEDTQELIAIVLDRDAADLIVTLHNTIIGWAHRASLTNSGEGNYNPRPNDVNGSDKGRSR